jgi:tetratricopeptide (TPR) repeat protein
VWDARTEVYRMIFEKRGDLEKIKELSDKYPENGTLLAVKARAFQEVGEHDTAATSYEEAAALTNKDDTKARHLADAAIQYAHARTKERALAVVERIKAEVPPSQHRQLMLLRAMREFARINKDDSLQTIVLEQLSELRPGDSARRFELAYEHADAGSKDMALHHYVKIPIGERNSTTWNNLGISFGEFGMPVKAIDAFEISANENETLAMSNLGYRLLAAGFLKEAKALSDKALALGEYHPNIPALAKRIIEVPDEENNTLHETLEKTRNKASFYRKLGGAVLESAPTGIGPQWKGPEGILHAAIGGDTLTLMGTFERPSLGGLLSLGFGAGLPPTAVRRVTHRTSFVGEIRGNVVTGQVSRKSDGDETSLLSEAMNAVRVLMYFNDAHTELSVMENPLGAIPDFYKIRQEG